MKILDGLRGVQRLGVDTTCLIYFIERHPDYFQRMLFIMRYIDSGFVDGMSASIALTEVLVQPLKLGHQQLVQQYETVLTQNRHFRLEPMTTEVARRAAYLRARYNLRMADALHLASALESGCDAFLTNDFGFKRVTDLPILILDELQV